jgi:hypothetical protein
VIKKVLKKNTHPVAHSSNGNFFDMHMEVQTMMKKLFLLTSLITLLVGCGQHIDHGNKAPHSDTQQQTKNELMDKSTKDTKQDKLPKETNEYISNPQVTDDQNLQRPGDYYVDEKGEATLKKIKIVNKTYNVGPIQLTVKDVKVIHLIPDYSLIDYFHALTHEEQFDFIKVFVEIKNTSSQKVNFAPVALLESSTGEKFDWEKDIYLENLHGEIEGNGTKQGNLGFILKEPNGEDVQWVKMITSDVVDPNKKIISKAKEIRLEF